MKLITKRNTLIALAALLVVLMAYMALSTVSSKRTVQQRPANQQYSELQKIRTQSNSDDVNSIEKDLNDTNVSDLDKEVQDIDNELSANQ